MQPTRALEEWVHNEQKYIKKPSTARTNSMCPCVRRKGIAAKIKLEDPGRMLLFPNIGL